jgi:hypothetical protein
MVVNTGNLLIDESEFNVCRFCNETNPDFFKSKAHIIPEFTGNKTLVHKNECDKCNNIFSKYERDLSLFGGIKNIIAGIKGKKYPKHLDKENNFYIFSTKDGLTIREHIKSDKIITNDTKFIIESKTQKFRPRFVHKALVKIALSLIPKTELINFQTTIQLLLNPEDKITEKEHPSFILIERESDIPLRKPAAMLMKRKTEYNSPEFVLLFYYSFWAYQIFIPFNKKDKSLDYNDIKLPLSTLVVTDLKDLKTVKFNHYHMTELKRVTLTDKFERAMTPI